MHCHAETSLQGAAMQVNTLIKIYHRLTKTELENKALSCKHDIHHYIYYNTVLFEVRNHVQQCSVGGWVLEKHSYNK